MMNFTGYNMPGRTRDSLERYVEHGLEPGSFVKAVLSNDLMDAYGRADTENREAIPDIAKFIFNEMPMETWGSREKVDKYLSKFHS